MKGSAPFHDDSQETPDEDWLDFDFGAMAKSELAPSPHRGEDVGWPPSAVAGSSVAPSPRRGEGREVGSPDADDFPASEHHDEDTESQDVALNDVMRAPQPRSVPSRLKSRLTSGAALLRSQQAENPSIAPFALGNLVRHPRYGLGKVVEIGRTLKRQTVTVQFEQDARRETFVSDKCPLTLVGLS